MDRIHQYALQMNLAHVRYVEGLCLEAIRKYKCGPERLFIKETIGFPLNTVEVCYITDAEMLELSMSSASL